MDHWTKENPGDMKEELNIAASEAFEYGGYNVFEQSLRLGKESVISLANRNSLYGFLALAIAK